MAKLHNSRDVLRKINNEKYDDYFHYKENTTIKIPITCNEINDLISPITFNNVELISDQLYSVMVHHFNHIPISCDVTIEIESKKEISNVEKNQFALAFKTGFLSSAIRAANTKRKLIKHALYVLTCFIICLVIVGVLEYFLILLDEQEVGSLSNLNHWIVIIVEEIMFIILWVLGWTFCDIMFFEMKKANKKINTRYQLYNCKLVYKKVKGSIVKK